MLSHACSAALAAVFLLGAAPAPPVRDAPAYDDQGRLLFPADYRQWTFLSSGLNMSYTPGPAMAGNDQFGNTFTPPAAYRSFLATAAWPDKTIIILENRGGAAKGSIARGGRFQTTEYRGAEAHVKDVARFRGGWGFFAFDAGNGPAREIAHSASCYSCHQEHAAVDTTFVQFYPTLLPTAIRLKALSRSYLSEGAAPGP